MDLTKQFSLNHLLSAKDDTISLKEENRKLKIACNLVLLFHSASHWDFNKQQDWVNGLTEILGPAIERDKKVVGANDDGTWDGATPTNEATTKNLCNVMRKVLSK